MPQIDTGVSFEDVDIGFPLADPGPYVCMLRFKEIKDSKSSQKPTAYFGLKPIGNVPCTITDPDGAVKKKEIADRELFEYAASLQPDGLRNLKELFLALGKRWKAKTMPDLVKEIQETGPGLNGLQVKAIISIKVLTQGDNAGRQVNRIEHLVAA
jgi:hypothetical protein